MDWVAGVVIVLGVTLAPLPLAPSPTNQLCYSSAAYRNTHEQECLIDQTPVGHGGGGGGRGLIGGLLHGLTGGLL